jgi:DNA invertase Pin-like site-specific DNA recombinase
MLIGYARVSKADGSQSLDLQRDALTVAYVSDVHLYSDRASGKKDIRPGLEVCLKALRKGDTLVIWKLDRLGRSLHHLVNTVNDLSECGINLKVLAGTGAQIDITTPAGRLSFGIFAALADFGSDLIRERAMANQDTSVSEPCKELGVKPVTLYRYVDPNGNLRGYGKRVLEC